jgi:hypothetical protein
VKSFPRRVVTVESAMTVSSTIATRRMDHLLLNAGHKSPAPTQTIGRRGAAAVTSVQLIKGGAFTDETPSFSGFALRNHRKRFSSHRIRQ